MNIIRSPSARRVLQSCRQPSHQSSSAIPQIIPELPHLFHSNSSLVNYSTMSSSNLSRGLYNRTLYDLRGANMFRIFDGGTRMLGVRELSSNSCVGIEAGTDGVVRFSFGVSRTDTSLMRSSEEEGKGRMVVEEAEKKKKKMTRKQKVNELKFYRLKAKRKMKSPNPAVRIRYKLEKAKRKEAWLIEKLIKFEIPKAPAETYDPESLTREEKFYLKRTGEKKKHYVPVGRRGVFGGVVLNMHLHWKNHETVKVVCKPCRPGQVHEIAEEISRLSKGIVIDIKPDNTVIFYRGKNYVQPEVMSPPDTLSKAKALEKYKYQQSLEHTSQFIEKLEKELEEYQEHLARYRKGKDSA